MRRTVKGIISLVAVVIAAIFVLSSCSVPTGSQHDDLLTPDASLTPELTAVLPTPTAKQSPEQEVLCNTFTSAFRTELILLNNWSMSIGYNDAAKEIRSIQRYILKARLLGDTLIPEALDAVRDTARSLYPGYSVEIIDGYSDSLPSWQYLAAVLPKVSDEEELMRILSVGMEINDVASRAISIRATISPIDIRSFCEYCVQKDPENANAYIDVRFTYAYMTAVYDKQGNERKNANYIFPNEYTDTLIFPLDDYIRISDTWAQGRSNNTRKHMGTDIRAEEKTPIKSCCAGTVLYKGFSDIPGNYILIIDDFGFEYHYYHLFEIPESIEVGSQVVVGDIIGLVGDTGNSDAPHLHLSLISPSGEFINPYSMLVSLIDA